MGGGSRFRRKRRYGKAHIGYGVNTPQLLDAGNDAPLSERGRLVWRVAVIVVIGLVVFLVAISR